MTTAIVAAAGSGKRMGGSDNKIFLPLRKSCVLVESLKALLLTGQVDRLVITAAAGDLVRIKEVVETANLPPVWQVVKGGSERQYSIQNALAAVPAEEELILVHDAARPLVSPSDVAAVITVAREQGTAVLGVPVKDTIKTVDDQQNIIDTPPRIRLWAIQTPQAFNAVLLRRAYDQAAQDGFLGTDDAGLVERLGIKVRMVQGSYENIKITTPEDMLLAKALSDGDEGEKRMFRIGHGYDVHRLVPDRKLILGGVCIPYTEGLEGHSDADVLAHAIMDALLGAAGFGDIGRHFPDTDDRYKDADSLMLMREVCAKLAAANATIHNVDATIVAQKPKLAAYIEQMNANIAAALTLPVGQVNVKATTTEGLGFAGRREGIAAHAVAAIDYPV